MEKTINQTPYIRYRKETAPRINDFSYRYLVAINLYTLLDMLNDPTCYTFNDFCGKFGTLQTIAGAFHDGKLYNSMDYEDRLAIRLGLNKALDVSDTDLNDPSKLKSLSPVVHDIKKNVLPDYENK